VGSNKPKLAAVHSPFSVGHVERRLDTLLHMLAEFLGGPSKWSGNPKPNFTVGYAAKGTADTAVFAERFRRRRQRRLLPLHRRERHFLCLRSCGRRRTRCCRNPRGWNERPICCRCVVCGKPVRWFGDLLSL